jgi:hypothetical protein
MFARRTTVLGTAAVLVLAAGTLLGSAPVVAADESITIRGGQVRGAFNRTASAWAVYLSQNVAGLKASAEASAGSIDNTRTVNAGWAQLGLVFASDLYQGYRGEDTFKKPQTDVRALTYLFGSIGHFVVPASSDIKKLEDIQGKTISMGGPGSGSAGQRDDPRYRVVDENSLYRYGCAGQQIGLLQEVSLFRAVRNSGHCVSEYRRRYGDLRHRYGHDCSFGCVRRDGLQNSEGGLL